MLTIEPLRVLDGIAMSKILFQEMLTLTNPVALEILASEIARKNISHAFELLDLELNLSSMECFLKEVLGLWGWFRIKPSQSRSNHELKLFHDYGIRWSSFLKSYLTSAFELTGKDTPTIQVAERLVKVKFPEKVFESPLGQCMTTC
jgi:hypothetical protein